MIVPFFRSSSLSQIKYCELSYFIVYNLGYQQDSQKKANLGTITHKVLEILAQCKKKTQDKMTPRMSIVDEELGKIAFTNGTLFSPEFVEQMLLLSFKHYTESDSINSYDDKDLIFCRNMVESAISHNHGQFDPRNRNIIATEPRFDIDIDEDWALFEWEGKQHRLSIKGTIDLVTRADDGVIEIIDWKTGQRKNWATGKIKTYEDLHDDIQLLLYHYAVKKLFPEYKQAILSIFFLRDGGPFSLCFDEADDEKFLKKLKENFDAIRQNIMPKPINDKRNDFRCTRLCTFYKNNWPGSNKRMCNYVEDHIKTYGIDVTQRELIKPGFKLGYYSAPGSTDKDK